MRAGLGRAEEARVHWRLAADILRDLGLPGVAALEEKLGGPGDR